MGGAGGREAIEGLKARILRWLSGGRWRYWGQFERAFKGDAPEDVERALWELTTVPREVWPLVHGDRLWWRIIDNDRRVMRDASISEE